MASAEWTARERSSDDIRGKGVPAVPRLYPFADPDAAQKLYWYRNCPRPKPKCLSGSLIRIAALLGVLVGGGLVLSQYRTASQLAVRSANPDEPLVESGIKPRPIILH
jgi:hypothetical protein